MEKKCGFYLPIRITKALGILLKNFYLSVVSHLKYSTDNGVKLLIIKLGREEISVTLRLILS